MLVHKSALLAFTTLALSGLVQGLTVQSPDPRDLSAVPDGMDALELRDVDLSQIQFNDQLFEREPAKSTKAPSPKAVNLVKSSADQVDAATKALRKFRTSHQKSKSVAVKTKKTSWWSRDEAAPEERAVEERASKNEQATEELRKTLREVNKHLLNAASSLRSVKKRELGEGEEGVKLGERIAVEVPPISLPAVELPPVTVPNVELPPVTLPPVTLPAIEAPAVTLPAVELPAVTLAQVALPDVDLPPVTLPPVPLPTVHPLPSRPTAPRSRASQRSSRPCARSSSSSAPSSPMSSAEAKPPRARSTAPSSPRCRPVFRRCLAPRPRWRARSRRRLGAPLTRCSTACGPFFRGLGSASERRVPEFPQRPSTFATHTPSVVPSSRLPYLWWRRQWRARQTIWYWHPTMATSMQLAAR